MVLHFDLGEYMWYQPEHWTCGNPPNAELEPKNTKTVIKVHLFFACLLVDGLFHHLTFFNQLVLLNPAFVTSTGLLLQLLGVRPKQWQEIGWTHLGPHRNMLRYTSLEPFSFQIWLGNFVARHHGDPNLETTCYPFEARGAVPKTTVGLELACPYAAIWLSCANKWIDIHYSCSQWQQDIHYLVQQSFACRQFTDAILRAVQSYKVPGNWRNHDCQPLHVRVFQHQWTWWLFSENITPPGNGHHSQEYPAASDPEPRCKLHFLNAWL